MRAKAAILFCCLLVYMLELAAIPVLVLPPSLQQHDQPVGTTACNSVPVKRCGAGEERACCETSCQHGPLGLVMSVAQVVTLIQPAAAPVRVYPTAPTEYWFMYLSESWKPPDVFSIAMNNKHFLQ